MAYINGHEIIRTGKNPLTLSDDVLSTVLQSASGQAVTMPLGDMEAHFEIGYSGLTDFTESGRFFYNDHRR